MTGATGYIGQRLLPVLVESGYHVVCCVRDQTRFNFPSKLSDSISIVEVDFLDIKTLDNLPDDVDAAYYLLHSMSHSKDYQKIERECAENFNAAVRGSRIEQVIYLGGIINEDQLSDHLNSRRIVENVLSQGDYHLTALRAGIIIGSGSASFEIIRDLVEKLPVMITPKWLLTKCQPIGISDVIKMLSRSLFDDRLYDGNYDIGGPSILSYKNMLLGYARVRGLSRRIWTVPVMTPRLSSYWLYFVTSTSYKLATALVESMKVEVVCRPSPINSWLAVEPIPYTEALERTLTKVRSNQVLSSWKDALSSGTLDERLSDFIDVPTFGCFLDQRKSRVNDVDKTKDRIWRIGGRTGWYYGNVLWRIRGFLDKIWGGVGLRRGRTHPDRLEAGDAVDFWRVLYANKEEGRLLLFAEMKLPGEAWLEFRVDDKELSQTATFRPKGILGRLYWYAVWPFHGFIFQGMLNKLAAD